MDWARHWRSGLANVYPGYKQGEMDEFKIDDARRQELAKVAMGNALMALGGGQGGMGQQGGQPQGMPPGQPSQPCGPRPKHPREAVQLHRDQAA